MNRDERIKKLLEILNGSEEPVSGSELARLLNVSRQVIVQDITLLRSTGKDIVSTHRGYIVNKKDEFTRVFKVRHSDDDAEKEMSLIVDLGGRILDVFIYHKVYNVVRAAMNIKSRRDVANFIEEIRSGKSSFLKNTTSGYHYHTVAADNELLLDVIEKELDKAGFLAKRQGYEPEAYTGSENV
jgi:transcriptional regulator of NAD metabolism